MNQTHAQSMRFYEYGKDIRKKPKVTKVVDTAADYGTEWWEHVARVRVICHINFYTINTKKKNIKRKSKPINP